MGQRTPLYDLHLALGAKMVDFGSWDMHNSLVSEFRQRFMEMLARWKKAQAKFIAESVEAKRLADQQLEQLQSGFQLFQ